MIVPVRNTFGVLTEHHYLGPTKTALFAWQDEHGAMVFSNPRSRHLPADWLELVRWCLTGGKNAGSKQWAAFARWGRVNLKASTIVSYSDPAQGHTGALYRACNWRWAPTWQRLRPPPTGNGSWSADKQQAVKDRWVFALADDARRPYVLALNDESLRRRMPWAEYREPHGGDFKRWRAAA